MIGRDIAVPRSLPSNGMYQILCLFDVEQIAETGEVEHLAHRLRNIAHDHISLALHSLQSAEQNTQSGAGDVIELSEIQSQLLCVADDFIDLGFKVDFVSLFLLPKSAIVFSPLAKLIYNSSVINIYRKNNYVIIIFLYLDEDFKGVYQNGTG